MMKTTTNHQTQLKAVIDYYEEQFIDIHVTWEENPETNKLKFIVSVWDEENEEYDVGLNLPFHEKGEQFGTRQTEISANLDHEVLATGLKWIAKEFINALYHKTRTLQEVSDEMAALTDEDLLSRHTGGDRSIMNEKLKPQIKVSLYMKTDKFEGIEFYTNEPIDVEPDLEAKCFRLEKHVEDGQTYILVASEEEFFVHEDVTHIFDVAAIEEECRRQLTTEDVPDATKEYLQFLNEYEE